MNLKLDIKPFSFDLLRPLQTSQGILKTKKGWLIHLQNSYGQSGWGEVAPLNSFEEKVCKKELIEIDKIISRDFLDNNLANWPKPIGFGIGSALAELDLLIGQGSNQDWLRPNSSAQLLSTNTSILDEVNQAVNQYQQKKNNLTLKLKVGIKCLKYEQTLVRHILDLLPSTGRLRLDANGGWNLVESEDWIQILENEPKLEWIEQPLPASEINQLWELSKRIPIALDESLVLEPSLYKSWKSWQIRRPLLEGDPRFLLNELNEGIGYRVISSTFETGIGRRWLNHLAALQEKGPTPTAPGLAPNWCPNSPLFDNDPKVVWDAA